MFAEPRTFLKLILALLVNVRVRHLTKNSENICIEFYLTFVNYLVVAFLRI